MTLRFVVNEKYKMATSTSGQARVTQLSRYRAVRFVSFKLKHNRSLNLLPLVSVFLVFLVYCHFDGADSTQPDTRKPHDEVVLMVSHASRNTTRIVLALARQT